MNVNKNKRILEYRIAFFILRVLKTFNYITEVHGRISFIMSNISPCSLDKKGK